MKKRLSVLALILISVVVSISSSKQVNVSAATPSKIYTLDLRQVTQGLRLYYTEYPREIYSPSSSKRYDIETFVGTLQGMANRTAPNLYVFNTVVPIFSYDNWGVQTATGTQNIDTLFFDETVTGANGWLNGIPQEAILVPSFNPSFPDDIWQGALINLVAKFPMNGIIAWDPNVPATVNVATTVAGVAARGGMGNFPVVRYDPAPDSLYTFATKSTTQGGLGLTAIINFAVPGIFADASGNVRTESGCGTTGCVPDTNGKVTSTGSSKNNAYLWAKYHYLDNLTAGASLDPSTLAYLEDGWALKDKSDITDCTLNRDIAVKRGAFVFDLSPVKEERPIDETNTTQPAGTDYNTFRSILASANVRLGNNDWTNGGGAKKLIEILGYVPLWDKYNTGTSCFKQVLNWAGQPVYVIPTDGTCPITQTHAGVGTAANAEYPAVRLASSYNAYYAHLCDNGTNLSFHSQAPVPPSYPTQSPPPAKALENKTYITFNLSDNDGPEFIAYMASIWKNSAKRGQYPVAWSFDPQPDLMPQIYKWFYLNKTDGIDYFTGGDTGVGWMFPNQLVPPRYSWYPISDPTNPQDNSYLPSGLNLWKTATKALYQQFNFSVTSEAWNNGALKSEVKQAFHDISPAGLGGMFIDETNTSGETEGLYESAQMPIKNYSGGSTGLGSLTAALDPVTGLPDDDVRLILNESVKADPASVTSNSQTKPNFLLFRDILHGPDYYWGLMNLVRQYQTDPNNPISKYNYEVVDPHTFFKLYKDCLSGVPPCPTPAPTPPPPPPPTSTSTNKLYHMTGDLTLNNNLVVGITGIIFVDGNLNINTNLTNTNDNTGLVFVVKGNVYINPTVTRIDAVLISAGKIYTAGTAPAGCSHSSPVSASQLIINGSLISLDPVKSIEFCRTLGAGNSTTPAEKIIQQPKYLVILRNSYSDTLQKWSEIP